MRAGAIFSAIARWASCTAKRGSGPCCAQFSHARPSKGPKSPGWTMQSLAPQRLVGRGAVGAGHGHVLEAQVHAQLRAMVNHMIHREGAQRHGTRQRENLLRPRAQGPNASEIGVLGGL